MDAFPAGVGHCCGPRAGSHHAANRNTIARRSSTGSLGLATMAVSPLAGKPAPESILVDLAALERAYYQLRPDTEDLRQRVNYGTIGHRRSTLSASLTE